MQDWLAGPARLTNKPEDEDRVLSLHDVCTALSFLHSRDLVHGALGSEAAMWFEGPRRCCACVCTFCRPAHWHGHAALSSVTHCCLQPARHSRGHKRRVTHPDTGFSALAALLHHLHPGFLLPQHGRQWYLQASRSARSSMSCSASAADAGGS